MLSDLNPIRIFPLEPLQFSAGRATLDAKSTHCETLFTYVEDDEGKTETGSTFSICNQGNYPDFNPFVSLFL